MYSIRIHIPQTLENGEPAEAVYMSLRKIAKSNIFKNPVEISKIKNNKTNGLRIKISFFKEHEKNFFLTLLTLLDYNLRDIEEEEKIINTGYKQESA